MNYAKELSDKDIARLHRHIPKKIQDGNCIIWKAAKNQHGYPLFWIGSQEDGRVHVATRIFYSLHNDVDIPDRDEDGERVVVRHTCLNRACVRGDHLVLTTHREALRRAHREGRYEGTFSTGIHHHTAKLTDGAVKHIRKLYAKGEYTQDDIAELYGVTKSCIKAVVKHQTWKHVK